MKIFTAGIILLLAGSSWATPQCKSLQLLQSHQNFILQLNSTWADCLVKITTTRRTPTPTTPSRLLGACLVELWRRSSPTRMSAIITTTRRTGTPTTPSRLLGVCWVEFWKRSSTVSPVLLYSGTRLLQAAATHS